ncbi:sigma factor [Oceanobacillus jeddahense]|uniref:sigma factor n=1 Tax=Oceanobacillus jeddahense TaxID=1462527 RepID=UPI0009DD18C6|nr:sigma factor [Oceanobacillus jeddahense]
MMKLEALYETYQSFLFSIAYRMLRSVSDAEDVVQDLFVEINLETFEARDMKSYLETINRFMPSMEKRKSLEGRRKKD